MKKEIVICIIIVILVVAGDVFTYNYTKKSVEGTVEELNGLRENLLAEEQDSQAIKNSINDIYDRWLEKHNKLAYYIEHDELEKVETDLNGLRGYIAGEEFTEAVAELDRTNYVLEHIKNKTALNLKNIF